MTGPGPHVYIPETIGKAPTSVSEALLSAAAVLSEEGRWLQDSFYQNYLDPDTPNYKDKPFCNGWAACAIGALQVVTVGVKLRCINDYSKPFDATAGEWPKVERWTAPEDEYAYLTDTDPDDWGGDEKELTDLERIYIRAHQWLDGYTDTTGRGRGVMSFNDDCGTTRDDVIRLLTEAATAVDKAA